MEPECVPGSTKATPPLTLHPTSEASGGNHLSCRASTLPRSLIPGNKCAKSTGPGPVAMCD